MSQWTSTKAKRVLAALLRIGWRIKKDKKDRIAPFHVLVGLILFLHFTMVKK